MHVTYRPLCTSRKRFGISSWEIWHRLSQKSGTLRRGSHDEHVFSLAPSFNHRTAGKDCRELAQPRSMEAIELKGDFIWISQTCRMNRFRL